MFGYFGKGFIAPIPAPTTSADAAAAKVAATTTAAAEAEDELAVDVAEEIETTPPPTPIPGVPSTETTEADIIKSRLDALRAAVEAQRAEKEAKIKALQEMQAKQAAYGRDVVQARPKEAGYATESEKLMGGRTGYGNYSRRRGFSGYSRRKMRRNRFGSYSQLGQTVDEMATEIKKSTAVVEQLTHDVQKGLATRSELETAMADLSSKIEQAKALAKKTGELKGYFGNENKGFNPLWILAGLGFLFFVLRPKG